MVIYSLAFLLLLVGIGSVAAGLGTLRRLRRYATWPVGRARILQRKPVPASHPPGFRYEATFEMMLDTENRVTGSELSVHSDSARSGRSAEFGHLAGSRDGRAGQEIPDPAGHAQRTVTARSFRGKRAEASMDATHALLFPGSPVSDLRTIENWMNRFPELIPVRTSPVAGYVVLLHGRPWPYYTMIAVGLLAASMGLLILVLALVPAHVG